MVKGKAKRVVVVDSPDRRFFEQAIFIVGGEAEKKGVSARELVEEARQVACSYAAGGRGRRLRRDWGGAVCAIMGGAVTGLVWLIVTLV